MTKAKNDTEKKTSLNEEEVTSPEPPLKGNDGGDISGEEKTKASEEGAASTLDESGEENGASAGEQASKQEEKAPSNDKKKDKAGAPTSKMAGTQASPNLRKAADRAKDIVEMMDSNKVDVLFENSKGEYFTSENLAHLSEKGAKDKVKTHRKETLELLIKSVE